MPSGLIENEHGMSVLCDLRGDFSQMQVHRLCVATGEDEPGPLAFVRTDRTEYIGRGGTLIGRRRGSCSAPCDLVFLSDPRFIGEPDFYALRRDVLFSCDLIQACGETFLKSSIATSVCA